MLAHLVVELIEGVFDAFDMAVSLSYGTRLSPTLAGGLTGKVIYSRIAPVGVAKELGRGVATAPGAGPVEPGPGG